MSGPSAGRLRHLLRAKRTAPGILPGSVRRLPRGRRVRLSFALTMTLAIAAQLFPTSIAMAASAADDAKLLARIPADIAAKCKPTEINPGVYPGENARVTCTPDGMAIAVYQQFNTVADMDAAFERDLGFATDATGDDCQVGPGQGGYTINSVHAGRLLCYELFSKAAIEWTDERLAVLTTAIGQSLDYGASYAWWQNAGPNPGPGDTGTPGGPTPGPVGTPIVSTPGPIPSGGNGGVGRPPSEGKAIIYHLLFSANIEQQSGLPIGLGDTFPAGQQTILAMLGWSRVQPGTELGIRLYLGDRFLGESKRNVVNPSNAGFVVPFSAQGGFPSGQYRAEVTYNGVPDEVATFCVADTSSTSCDTSATPTTPGLPANPPGGTAPTGTDLGPVDYADPATVLVVTRTSVLRSKLGAQADQVLAAAAAVGQVQDLDTTLGTGPITDWHTSVTDVQNRLRGGQFRYLLILGNDDAVPFAQLPNPMAAQEKEDLDPWQLPSDVIASDDPYGDLDGDQPLGIPDIGVARIPSSEDAALLLTQLGTVTTPPTGAFALINAQRRSQAGAVEGVISNAVSIDGHFAPPTKPEQLPSTSEGKTRFMYVLLHGIGVTTDEWAGDIQSWKPLNTSSPFTDEWDVSVGAQAAGMTIPYASSAGTVVNVGACYGAWTLDTIQEPKHKTSSNNLALSFLKSGTRAFIADTHLSYTTGSVPGGLLAGRTGFEIALWQGITGGATPIDAYLNAKRVLGDTTKRLIDQGGSAGDTINLNIKTIHHMVYLGRP
jgi:hypothetical protein